MSEGIYFGPANYINPSNSETATFRAVKVENKKPKNNSCRN